MKVDLSPELERLVEVKLKSGRYTSVGEVVQEALRLLERRDAKELADRDEVRRQVEEGWQEARSGEVVDGDQVFDRIDAELEQMERLIRSR